MLARCLSRHVEVRPQGRQSLPHPSVDGFLGHPQKFRRLVLCEFAQAIKNDRLSFAHRKRVQHTREHNPVCCAVNLDIGPDEMLTDLWVLQRGEPVPVVPLDRLPARSEAEIRAADPNPPQVGLDQSGVSDKIVQDFPVGVLPGEMIEGAFPRIEPDGRFDEPDPGDLHEIGPLTGGMTSEDSSCDLLRDPVVLGDEPCTPVRQRSMGIFATTRTQTRPPMRKRQ